MESKTNNIDDFQAHWDTTLLGPDFWKDAEDWNKETNDRIETVHDQSLHTRFPFNLVLEQGARAPPIAATTATATADSDEAVELVIPEKKRSRRFSMSDAFDMSSLSGRSRSCSRSFSCSRSGSNNRGRSSSVAAEVRRSSSMIRSTFNMLSGRKKIRNGEAEKEQELMLQVQEQVNVIPIFTLDQATPERPLKEFRGGALWEALPKNRRKLGLDIFWPIPPDKLANKEEKENEPTVFPIEEMKPLFMFRSLRALKITGMMQSYQMCIFQTAWLNTNLEELEIGMALAPRLCRGYKWPYMKGGWRFEKATTYSEPVYYGTGEGTLLKSVGTGEYLDKICLEKAKTYAMAMGETRQRLSIRTLVLTGVVVDADPFLHWFDPKRLKCINFKDRCVDAGFWLPYCMRKVSILFPREIYEPVVTARRVNPLAELKVIEIKGGKKVGEIPYRGPKSLEEEIPINVGGGIGDVKKAGKKKENTGREKEHAVDEDQIGIAI
ncbi:hypothetical protein BJX76DRAFT_365630 [Aspergillus varians]